MRGRTGFASTIDSDPLPKRKGENRFGNGSLSIVEANPVRPRIVLVNSVTW